MRNLFTVGALLLASLLSLTGLQQAEASSLRLKEAHPGAVLSRNNSITVPIQGSTVTISGISAGAAMVIQYQFAFSSTIRAAGVVAGLPFYCAQDELVLGAYACMDDPETISLSTLISEAKSAARQGQLDPLSNIKDHFMLLWSGTKDSVVAHGTMILVDEMYTQHLGVPRNRTVAVFNYSAEHAWVTNFYGNSCGHLGSPWMNNCGYDFAGQFLSRSWESMGLGWNSTLGTYRSANLYDFDMGHFGASSLIGLDATGYIYIPSQCKSGGEASSCKLHVNFHGCNQARTQLTPRTRYVAHTGLNEWAETNDIVVLYPQVVPTSVVPYNPKGCFDWWGYVNSNYSNKQSAQMQVIHSAVQWLLGHN